MIVLALASRCGQMHKTGFWGGITGNVVLEKCEFNGVLHVDWKKNLKSAIYLEIPI